MRQRDEQGLVQQLVAQSPIEAFDAGVLRRLAGGDGVPRDANLGGLGQDDIAGQLCAVVADDRLGLAADGDQAVELTRNPAAGERDIGHRCQARSGAVIIDVRIRRGSSARRGR